MISGIPLVRRLKEPLKRSYDSMATLITFKPLMMTTVLSIFAWFCECTGFYIVLKGFHFLEPSIGVATFIYAFATIAGAVSMLPGGLGTTEAVMMLMVMTVFPLTDNKAQAGAATILIRFCTLWFAVILGFVSLGIWRAFVLHPRQKQD
jgi:uncharacterized protein (TIRG00374 family)